jgi:hypothetical protein
MALAGIGNNSMPGGRPPRSAGGMSVESDGARSLLGEDVGEYTTALPDMSIKDKSGKERERKGGFRGVLPFRGKKERKDSHKKEKKEKERDKEDKKKGKEREKDRSENRSPERGGSAMGRYDDGGRGKGERDEEF